MAITKLGYKVLTFIFENEDSEPLCDVPPDDPLVLLSVGDKIEVFFRSSNETKTVIVTEIDMKWDGVFNGYIGRIKVMDVNR